MWWLLYFKCDKSLLKNVLLLQVLLQNATIIIKFNNFVTNGSVITKCVSTEH